MKSGRTLVSLAQELERQLHSKKDLIVPSQLVHHSTGDDGRTHIVVNEAGNPVATASRRWRAASWPTS